MSIELVGDEDPRCLGIGLDGLFDVGHEVFFRPRGADRWTDDPAGDHVKFAMRHRVPWRMYSNSTRSTRPGRTDFASQRRSSACIPVFSSVLTTCAPSAASCAAAKYVSQSFSTSAWYCSGASRLSFDVSQYCDLCGQRRAALKNGRPGLARCSRQGPVPWPPEPARGVS